MEERDNYILMIVILKEPCEGSRLPSLLFPTFILYLFLFVTVPCRISSYYLSQLVVKCEGCTYSV